jgi:hypothetical protein
MFTSVIASIDDTDPIEHTDNRFGANDVPSPFLAFLHHGEEVFLRVVEVLLEGNKPGIALVCRGRHRLKVYLWQNGQHSFCTKRQSRQGLLLLTL